jgi:hypothetical protein
MIKKRTILFGVAALLTIITATAEPKPEPRTWTDPEIALREDPDFALQGEYRSAGDEAVIGAQVVALGKGQFEMYILEGGLPGAGWEPALSRTLLKGERKDDKIAFVEGNIAAAIENGAISLTKADGTRAILNRIERSSPTLNTKPPEGAVVLFDGASTDAWLNGKLENGLMMAVGSTSKQQFGDYKLHLEFRTPYKPDARSQKRGNSGIYQSGRWETQILDSFGLEGKDNECGGIYSIAKPRLNMCLPPLVWQTYDVDFTAAKFDAMGNRTAWPRITVRLNGVLVHEDRELTKDFTPAAPISKPLTSPEGPIFLQQHDNPVAFRNIWIVPGK